MKVSASELRTMLEGGTANFRLDILLNKGTDLIDSLPDIGSLRRSDFLALALAALDQAGVGSDFERAVAMVSRHLDVEESKRSTSRALHERGNVPRFVPALKSMVVSTSASGPYASGEWEEHVLTGHVRSPVTGGFDEVLGKSRKTGEGEWLSVQHMSDQDAEAVERVLAGGSVAS